MGKKNKRKTSRGKRKLEAPDEEDKALSPLPLLPSFDDIPTFTIQSHTPSQEKSARKRSAGAISDAEESSKEDSSSNPAKRRCSSNEDIPKGVSGDTVKDTTEDAHRDSDSDSEGQQRAPIKRRGEKSPLADPAKRFRSSNEEISKNQDEDLEGWQQVPIKKRKGENTSPSPTKRQRSSNEDTPKEVSGGKDEDSEGWQHVPVRRKKGEVPNRGKSYPEIVVSSQRIHTWTRISDLQGLALHLLSFDAPPQWLHIKNKSAIRRAVYLYVPGLSMDLFDRRTPLIPKASVDEEPPIHHSTLGEFFPWSLTENPLPKPLGELSDIFTHVLPVRAGGDGSKVFSPVYNMLNIPVEADPKKKNQKRNNKREARLKISDLLLSTEDLIENEYPIHSSQIPEDHSPLTDQEGWVETSLTDLPPRNNEAGSTLEGYKVYSLDCEMVKTSVRPSTESSTESSTECSTESSLARVSLISWDGDVVFDSLVKPSEPVVDYLTPFSGITEAMLRDVTTTRADIQNKLKELIDGNTILIGQSLNSDLNALRMRHPRIVDTSVIYDHPRGKPMKPSLKWLTNKFLKKEIQIRGAQGHDSVEDSKACLDLVKLKLEKGKEFGSTAANFESIFTKLAASKPAKTGAVIDYGDVQKKFGTVAQFTKRGNDDDQIVEGVLKAANGDDISGIAPVDFTWAQLRDLNTTRGWHNSYQKFITEMNTKMITANSPPIAIPEKPTPLEGEELGKVVEETVGRIKKIYDGLPKCSVLVVYGGTGDPVEMGRLNAMQAVYRKEYKVKKWDECSVKWTDKEVQELKKAVEEARKGVALLAVK
ncbi:hypothetical protein TWF106_010399 [Orbilia oligospora]|uniref:Exonuclease domain-containing protein n=1 Tax=Orbilia oligospora TaxID=2813651 RepID=A0A6G1MD12_ORBOL|nr:hypothetical protein TWF679_009959 [Orbilia oligospora]KAF3211007.1 hypothetical protein TWF106_010399 [Orbilia oligospora]KAF3251784.1 hypothetical protein TWF192_004741 [Orbilia oligospora]